MHAGDVPCGADQALAPDGGDGAGDGDRVLVRPPQGVSLAADRGVYGSVLGTAERRVPHDPEPAVLFDGGDVWARAGEWDSEARVPAGGYDRLHLRRDLRG